MKKIASIATNILMISGILGVIVFSTFGLAKLGKSLSYSWWYEDQVKQTVRQMVNDSALKK